MLLPSSMAADLRRLVLPSGVITMVPTGSPPLEGAVVGVGAVVVVSLASMVMLLART